MQVFFTTSSKLAKYSLATFLMHGFNLDKAGERDFALKTSKNGRINQPFSNVPRGVFLCYLFFGSLQLLQPVIMQRHQQR
jgi:hypothetical protein